MSNRVDFFQGGPDNPAIPAATVSVSLDGTPCPFFELKEVVRSGTPEFNWAKLSYNLRGQGGGGLVRAENIEKLAGMGKSICIEQIVNTGRPDIVPERIPVFYGYIEKIETTIDSNIDQVEIIAKDISAKLDRIKVYGRRVANGGSSLFLHTVETIFNANAQPNAASVMIQNEGRTYRVFGADSFQSRFWSYAEVIIYLLNEYVPVGRLWIPEIELLESLGENQTVRDFDVTGLSVLEALQKCCEKIGVEFRFVPRLSETGPREAIVFYRPGQGRAVELNCQIVGEKLDLRRTNIASIRSSRNLWPVTHRFTGAGDFKIYEATFDLVKAWDPTAESTNYETFSPSMNENFHQVKDVYRKWALNEAGDYTDSPYNRGDPFDFSQIFETGTFLHRRRRFYPAITCDKQDKSIGYYLEASYDYGNHWHQYLEAFNILLDECGIWLSSDQLDVQTWFGVLKDAARFRITASVISDLRLNYTAANGPVNSVAEIIDHIVMVPRRFKYHKISNFSIFAGATNENISTNNQRDDTAELVGFVRQSAKAYSSIIEQFDIKTVFLAFDYQPGDGICTSPEGRDLLGCRLDNRSMFYIKRVVMDFECQCTNLKIVRKRN
ncbi:MAG: hypothetical protein ABIG61_08055 [Planctomycetota bacterium]